MKLTHDGICICGNKGFSRVFVYTEPPEKEVRFESVQHDKYYREVLKCDLCGHCVSLSEMDLTALYTGDYVASNYSDIGGIHENFKRINSLDNNTVVTTVCPTIFYSFDNNTFCC